MKTEFIANIYNNNQTAEGREHLYYELSDREERCWNEVHQDNISNWTEIFTQKAKKHSTNIILQEVDTNLSCTYQELEDASNKIMNFILENISEQQIGLNYHNSFNFIATLIAINKAEKLAILFNNREPLERIERLADDSKTKVVFGNAIKGLKHFNIDKVLESKASASNTIKTNPKKSSLEDPAFVIFTSGTSGPSKPALFSHRRMIGAGIAWSLRTGMEEKDNCYIPLPLYHGNALAVAFSSVIYSGATAILRPKFSVSSFWKDINHYQCSQMVYIGELWRYLINKKEANNPNKSLKVIFGNGLNKALWDKVVSKYQIEHVVEHFGSTEMPAGALTNWMNVSGFCGYLPPSEARLQEMVLVDETFKAVEVNQNGEALFLVPNGHYKGYLNPKLDETKIYKNLFVKNDVWWKSGDLLQVNENGFYTFIERLGDTYRFKGENVACVDVEEAIRQSGSFEEVVVYGIELPLIDGKIGMASLVLQDVFSIEDANTLLAKLQQKLAKHALPYILRIQKEKHQTTSTLKIQKTHLVKNATDDFSRFLHYILLNGSYLELDDLIIDRLLKSEIILGGK